MVTRKNHTGEETLQENLRPQPHPLGGSEPVPNQEQRHTVEYKQPQASTMSTLV
jgi:hypothetical protein